MFGIGFFEILVIAVLGLLVFGPEKLPEAIRTFAIGITKAKRTWSNARRELEQELGMDEIRREIHNAQVMADMEKIKALQSSKEEQEEESDLLRESASPTKLEDLSTENKIGADLSNNEDINQQGLSENKTND